MVRCTVNF